MVWGWAYRNSRAVTRWKQTFLGHYVSHLRGCTERLQRGVGDNAALGSPGTPSLAQVALAPGTWLLV